VADEARWTMAGWSADAERTVELDDEALLAPERDDERDHRGIDDRLREDRPPHWE
jgi:hypothetical protein